MLMVVNTTLPVYKKNGIPSLPYIFKLTVVDIQPKDTLLDLIDVCTVTVLPAKSESDVTFCLQSYQGLRIDRSLVY